MGAPFLRVLCAEVGREKARTTPSPFVRIKKVGAPFLRVLCARVGPPNRPHNTYQCTVVQLTENDGEPHPYVGAVIEN